jgi:hypothetical protein
MSSLRAIMLDMNPSRIKRLHQAVIKSGSTMKRKLYHWKLYFQPKAYINNHYRYCLPNYRQTLRGCKCFIIRGSHKNHRHRFSFSSSPNKLSTRVLLLIGVIAIFVPFFTFEKRYQSHNHRTLGSSSLTVIDRQYMRQVMNTCSLWDRLIQHL